MFNMTMESPENRPHIDPMYRYESDTSTRPAQRLRVVEDFLKRDVIANLSLLETHIVEQAIGNFLKEGKIGFYSSLNGAAYMNPPERIYMDDEDDEKDDVRRTMLQLESKGILKLNEETAEYEFGTPLNSQTENK